jgi:hypothetical protein
VKERTHFFSGLSWVAFFIFSSCSYFCSAQYFDSISPQEKIRFIYYLSSHRQVSDAYYLLHHLNSREPVDSLVLLESKLALALRKELAADSLLTGISNTADPMIQCRHALMKNHCSLMVGKYDHVQQPSCPSTHTLHLQVWKIQLLSSLLLQNKHEEMNAVMNSAKLTDHSLTLIEFDLYVQGQAKKHHVRKKPFLAGLFSAIIPGLGKIYAGKPHEALTGFLPVVFNGAQAAEGYYYRRFNSPHLYFFGTVGTLFYFSGIYGSAKAASRKNTEFETDIHYRIENALIRLIPYY